MKKEHKAEMKRRRRNISFTVAYDGTNYHGFQRQTNGVVAVQNVLEDAMEKVFGDSIELAAAGRTDAGVHAWGQRINFFTDGKIPAERAAMAVNSLLPADIALRDGQEAPRDFSARHNAKSKIYTYKICMSKTRNPLVNRYSWHIPYALDLSDIKAALETIKGEHDFTSFCAAGGAKMNPVRVMYDARLKVDGEMLTITFHGNGFLYHMVRNIVGTLADVGEHRLSVADFADILAAKDRQKASPTAPARGLCLWEVKY